MKPEDLKSRNVIDASNEVARLLDIVADAPATESPLETLKRLHATASDFRRFIVDCQIGSPDADYLLRQLELEESGSEESKSAHISSAEFEFVGENAWALLQELQDAEGVSVNVVEAPDAMQMNNQLQSESGKALAIVFTVTGEIGAATQIVSILAKYVSDTRTLRVRMEDGEILFSELDEQQKQLLTKKLSGQEGAN